MNANSEAMGAFDANAHFPSLEAADAYLAQHGQSEAFAAIADQGEYILIARKAKAEAKKADAKPAAKAKGKAKAGRKSNEARQADQRKADADAKAAKAEKPAKRDFIANPKWAKLSDRKWIGKWADFEASAKAGKLPDAMGAKAERKDLFGGIFAAETHRPFEKRILALAALIRAKDEKGLKALEIKEISTSPIMLGKLRDLAIAALQAKAEKPAKANGKAKPAPDAEAQAPQA